MSLALYVRIVFVSQFSTKYFIGHVERDTLDTIVYETK